MKENKLFFSSSDNGESFNNPQMIKLPYYASAEQPGGMYVDKDGAIYMVYSPYPSIEKKEPVDSKCMVLLKSTDGNVILIENEPIWKADCGTKNTEDIGFENWTDFSFGEPSVVVLPDKSILITLWYQKGNIKGIKYIQVKKN